MIKQAFRSIIAIAGVKSRGHVLDLTSKNLTEGEGTFLLSGNSKWVGPGGESLLLQKSGDFIVYHAHDTRTGQPSLHFLSSRR